MATGPIFNDAPDRPQPRTPSAPPLGKEPWYYGFLVFYAYSLMVLGVLIGGLLVGFVMLSLVRAGDPASISTLLVGLVWPLSIVFGSVAVGAPILLAVDAARNLRASRGR